MSDRLFDIEGIPEIPLFREPRRSRGESDARFRNEYPPEWDRCPRCGGRGRLSFDTKDGGVRTEECPACLGMGSLKARVRLEAGHRCARCKHHYIPKNDAKMLRLPFEFSPWTACDDQCAHNGPLGAYGPEGLVLLTHEKNGDGLSPSTWRARIDSSDFEGLLDQHLTPDPGATIYAAWRILTVHHLDGDKANVRWWNLAALCQVCHLHIQNKVVMERVYPYPHSEWFRPYVAGYYAHVYLGLDLSREEVEARMDELLALEATVDA